MNRYKPDIILECLNKMGRDIAGLRYSHCNLQELQSGRLPLLTRGFDFAEGKGEIEFSLTLKDFADGNRDDNPSSPDEYILRRAIGTITPPHPNFFISNN